MTDEIIARPEGGPLPVPAIIGDAGDETARRFIEVFTLHIGNFNTRVAYARAVAQFLRWCEGRKLALRDIETVAVASYIEGHTGSDSSRRQHLAAIKMFFDCLVAGQVVPFNPASSVSGPKYVSKKGQTPVLSADEVRRLFASIKLKIGKEPKPGEKDARSPNLIGLRDRAMIGVMVYNFARIGAVVGLSGEDYYRKGNRWWLRLHEKGGKPHKVPVHPIAKSYLDAYIQAAGIEGDRKSPLFRSVAGRSGRLTGRRLNRWNSLGMVIRRARLAGLHERVACHTLRATGITDYLENGGTIEKARGIAAHKSPLSTKLYDRTSE